MPTNNRAGRVSDRSNETYPDPPAEELERRLASLVGEPFVYAGIFGPDGLAARSREQRLLYVASRRLYLRHRTRWWLIVRTFVLPSLVGDSTQQAEGESRPGSVGEVQRAVARLRTLVLEAGDEA